MAQLYGKLAYYRNKVSSDIQFGYHDEKRATHNDGLHHKRYLENRKELEKAVKEVHSEISRR